MEQILKIAETILSELNHFDDRFEVNRPVTENVFAVPEHEFIQGSRTRQAHTHSQSTKYMADLALKDEPFVVYLKGEEDGEERIFLICRNCPPEFGPTSMPGEFVSYMSPLGKIASKPVGSEFKFEYEFRKNYYQSKEGVRKIRILEKNEFRPKRSLDRRDGIHNNISLIGDEYFVESLLEFAESNDIAKKNKIRRGRKKELIERMSLRDQPILDDIQDDIFRLPVSSQIILAGAPGTGKTTVLIKRLKQKSDPMVAGEHMYQENLSPQEKEMFWGRNN